MNRYKIIFFICFLILSCQEKEKTKVSNVFNPYKEIPQVLTIIEARQYYDLAVDSRNDGDFSSAYKFLNKALEFEKSPIIYNEFGTIAILEGKYDEALVFLSEGKKADPKYWSVYINESICYIQKEQFLKAEELLLDMIEKCDSEYFISYANLYLAISYSGNRRECEKALECLKKTDLLNKDTQIVEMVQNLRNKIKNNCQ